MAKTEKIFHKLILVSFLGIYLSKSVISVELHAKTLKETRSARFHDGNVISQASYEKNSFGSGYIVAAQDSEGKICIGILTSQDKFWTTSIFCNETKTPFKIFTESLVANEGKVHDQSGSVNIFGYGVFEIPFSPPLDTPSYTKVSRFLPQTRPIEDTNCVAFYYSAVDACSPDVGANPTLTFLSAKVTTRKICTETYGDIHPHHFCAHINNDEIIQDGLEDDSVAPVCKDDTQNVLVCYLPERMARSGTAEDYNADPEMLKLFCILDPTAAKCSIFCFLFPYFCSVNTIHKPEPQWEKYVWQVSGISVIRTARPCKTSDPILYTTFLN